MNGIQLPETESRDGTVEKGKFIDKRLLLLFFANRNDEDDWDEYPLHLNANKLPSTLLTRVPRRPSSLGAMTCLPPELIDQVLCHLDPLSLLRFASTAVAARQLVHTQTLLKLLYTRATDMMLAIAQYRLLNNFTLLELHAALQETKCRACGALALYMALPMLERCCSECRMHNLRFASVHKPTLEAALEKASQEWAKLARTTRRSPRSRRDARSVDLSKSLVLGMRFVEMVQAFLQYEVPADVVTIDVPTLRRGISNDESEILRLIQALRIIRNNFYMALHASKGDRIADSMLKLLKNLHLDNATHNRPHVSDRCIDRDAICIHNDWMVHSYTGLVRLAPRVARTGREPIRAYRCIGCWRLYFSTQELDKQDPALLPFWELRRITGLRCAGYKSNASWWYTEQEFLEHAADCPELEDMIKALVSNRTQEGLDMVTETIANLR